MNKTPTNWKVHNVATIINFKKNQSTFVPNSCLEEKIPRQKEILCSDKQMYYFSLSISKENSKNYYQRKHKSVVIANVLRFNIWGTQQLWVLSSQSSERQRMLACSTVLVVRAPSIFFIFPPCLTCSCSYLTLLFFIDSVSPLELR